MSWVNSGFIRYSLLKSPFGFALRSDTTIGQLSGLSGQVILRLLSSIMTVPFHQMPLTVLVFYSFIAL